MRYVDSKTFAENPGNVMISARKFRKVRRLFKLNHAQKSYFKAQKNRIKEYMAMGDTQPAVVCSVSPLKIAAYSDEMDAVIMLRFPDVLAKKYDLSPGTRLVTSNVYEYKSTGDIASDIFIGENYYNRYRDFIPVLTLFLADNEKYLRRKPNIFGEDVWKTVCEKAEEYSQKHPDLFRNGFFYLFREEVSVK